MQKLFHYSSVFAKMCVFAKRENINVIRLISFCYLQHFEFHIFQAVDSYCE